ncbi:hypothetical protein UlMin_036963, partial [Ulmus minor]
TIPKEIGNSTNLKELWLYENHLTGAFNNFTGTIPPFIFNMSRLKLLSLSNNYFSGMFPDKMCHTLSNLEELYLRSLNLKGRISSQLSQCGKLHFLELGWNTLTGSIPSILFNKSHLEFIDISHNKFDPICLPENICGNLPNLKELYMSGINLGGHILSQLSQCGNLSKISLEMNNFVGSIPQTIGNLTNLEELYLGNNKLT